MSKTDFRSEIKSKRNELSREYVEKNSRIICESIMRLPEYTSARSIMLYNAVGNEVSLSYLIKKAADDGKTVMLPRCICKGIMEALEYDPLNRNLTADFEGIAAPNSKDMKAVDPETIDIVICPCVAFDNYGNRIGMGAGYYDRFLVKCKNAAIIIAAFEIQKIDFTNPGPNDFPVSAAVTEKETYMFES